MNKLSISLSEFLIFLTTILILTFLIVGCTNKKASTDDNNKNTGVYQKISAEETKKLLDNKEAILVDVRTSEENRIERIPNSILIEVDNLEEEAESKLPNKDKKIIVYCRSGNRSKKAVNILLKKGYTNVYDLGGINNWPYDKESK